LWYLDGKKGGVLMKRFFALVLVLLSIMGTVYAETYDFSSLTDEELNNLFYAVLSEMSIRSEKNNSYIDSMYVDRYWVGLKSAEVSNDDTLYLKMDFTNFNDEAMAFSYCFTVEVYQGGISCEPIFYKSKNATTKIKDGALLEVTYAFSLMSSENVEVEISEVLGEEKITVAFQMK
jgi:hypothetical protein